MIGTLQQLAERFRLSKRQHTTTFGIPGTPGHEALKNLAIYCRAFSTEISPGGPDQVMFAAGMRHAFFYLYNQLHLEPDELVAIYRAAVVRQGDDQ